MMGKYSNGSKFLRFEWQLPKVLLFVLIYCVSPVILSAADAINQSDVDKLTKDMDFDKKKKIWSLKEFKKSKKDVKKEVAKEDKKFGSFDGLVNGFAIALVSILFILIAYFVVKDMKKRSAVNDAEFISLDNISDIKKVNFLEMLQEALVKKDYRLAVRIRFLMLLQILQNKQLILWKPDKTNRAYARELSNSDYGNDFRVLSSIFEKTWYGNIALDQDVFDQIDHRFNQLKV